MCWWDDEGFHPGVSIVLMRKEAKPSLEFEGDREVVWGEMGGVGIILKGRNVVEMMVEMMGSVKCTMELTYSAIQSAV